MGLCARQGVVGGEAGMLDDAASALVACELA